MSIRTRVAAAAVVATAATAPLVMTALPAHAAPPNTSTASASAKASSTHQFGQTVTVDGFKVKATYHDDGKLKSGELSGYTEKVTVHVTPTKQHKSWKPNDGWQDAVKYGKHLQKKADLVSSSVFKDKQPWVESNRFATNKSHYAHHLQYTFTFRGEHITWVK